MPRSESLNAGTLPKTDDVALIAFYRGFGEYNKGNMEPARKEFDRAFELDASLLQAQIGNALSLRTQNQVPQAADALRSMMRSALLRAKSRPEMSEMPRPFCPCEEKSTSPVRTL
jgi:Tfp pilus assembly protein PilF